MATAKSILWNKLKLGREMGISMDLDKSFVQYTEAELTELVQRYGLSDDEETIETEEPVSLTDYPSQVPLSRPEPPRVSRPQAAPRPAPQPVPQSQSPAALAAQLGVPLADRPAERAGLTFNSHGKDDPVRVDGQGRVWYQDEILKPAIPKPRMRRVVRTTTQGAVMKERRNADGTLDESFEVAGGESRQMEIKVTLPSWQVGIYKDPRMPFKIHQYNGLRGFDFNEIVIFYGGIDLVPGTIKRTYVGGDLCFDIKSTRETMNKEHRDMMLGRNFS